MARYTVDSTRHLGNFNVMLDEQRVSDVFEADDEIGFVIVADKTTDGAMRITRDGSVAKKILLGKVQIVMCPEVV